MTVAQRRQRVRRSRLAGHGIVAQGIVFDLGGSCLRLTDALEFTVHWP